MKRILQALFAVALLAQAGCFTRAIVSIDDHPTTNASLVETHDHSNWLVYHKFVRQFWECEDKGKEMVCHPSCNYSRDVECPTDMLILGYPTSNIKVLR